MPGRGPRRELAEKIAGEIALSDDPGATVRKWRTDFDVSQTELAEELGVSSSVVSDYESGRRESPGIALVRRLVDGLLAIDERRGGERIRQHGRILSAGFDGDVVHDLREYATSRPLSTLYAAVDATEVTAGASDRIAGHTVVDSIEAITRLSSGELLRLYGQSTNRALVFTNVTRGEGVAIALRVVDPTPSAVLLHGLEAGQLWEHAADLARMDGYSLAATTTPLETVLDELAAIE